MQRQNFDVNAVDDFEDIEVKLERGGWNERTIIGFRIDPGTAGNIEAEIDYISFTGIPGATLAVNPKGKAATPWGKIKNQ